MNILPWNNKVFIGKDDVDKSGAYYVQNCSDVEEIEVEYLDQDFKLQHGTYSGWTAQIIQHELDHVAGIVI